MATPTDYLSEEKLKAIDANGFVREDVIDKILDSSEFVQPILYPMLETVPVANSFKEWPEDKLADPTDSSVVSGADAAVPNQTLSSARRVGNHSQVNQKVVAVETRARHVNVVGMSDPLEYQTRRKLLELRRDMEARILGNQGSIANSHPSTKGVTAGLGAWIETNYYPGYGGGPGGFDNSSKLVLPPTAGVARSITLEDIRTAVEAIYEEGGGDNGLKLMSTPKVVKAISEALRTDATGNFVRPVANITGDGKAVDQFAQGWTNKFVTDFGIVIELIPNRLFPTYEAGENANVYLLDTNYLAKGFVHDVLVEPLAKIGLSDRRQISVDWMLIPLLERAQACIADVSTAAPVDNS